MAAPQPADHGLVLEEQPEAPGLKPEERHRFWITAAKIREELRRHAPPAIAARLPRVERVELKQVHGELMRISICSTASCEDPIDLDRQDWSAPRNWLVGVEGWSVLDTQELREYGFSLVE